MKTIATLSREIGEWAQANFGNTPVTNLLVRNHDDEINSEPLQGRIVELNWIAPLWGIGEEIGELCKQSTWSNGSWLDESEVKDAIADTGIYFCDYLYRRGFTYNVFNSAPKVHKHLCISLAEAYGELLHVELKHAQGIRGMNEIQPFKSAHKLACQSIYGSLQSGSNAFTGKRLEILIDDVFQETVSKRNWKKNKESGN